MGLGSHLLLQSRSNFLLANAERRDTPRKEALAQSRRLQNCGKLSATTTRKRSVFRRYSGFSSALDCGFSNWKRTNREGFLIRHRFAIAAVSADSEDAAQNFTEAAKCPCLYLQGTVSSGNTIRYPGSVVVLGDVQEGGAVIADGDIVVLGWLYGDVHGGWNGEKSAVVYATQLDDACHIRIGESVALVSTTQFGGCPVIASIQEDGTLGIRAAAQKLKDIKEGRNSSNLRGSAEKEASIGSESTTSKRPAQLALFTGVYISAVGMALLIFPTPLFGTLFDVRTVTVGWIRVGAVLAVVFGVYYIGTAIGDMRGKPGARSFYMSTVVGRVVGFDREADSFKATLDCTDRSSKLKIGTNITCTNQGVGYLVISGLLLQPFLFFSFCWLVAAGAAQRALLLVGVVNLLGAMSMFFALQQDSRARAMKV